MCCVPGTWYRYEYIQGHVHTYDWGRYGLQQSYEVRVGACRYDVSSGRCLGCCALLLLLCTAVCTAAVRWCVSFVAGGWCSRAVRPDYQEYCRAVYTYQGPGYSFVGSIKVRLLYDDIPLVLRTGT